MAMILTFIKKILIKCNILSIKNITHMNKHWIRVICDEETEKLVKAIYPEQLSAFEISGNRWEQYFKNKNYNKVEYPDFDIQNYNDFSKKYDLIILEHVMEHIPMLLKSGEKYL